MVIDLTATHESWKRFSPFDSEPARCSARFDARCWDVALVVIAAAEIVIVPARDVKDGTR
jgi:hypothetical protein